MEPQNNEKSLSELIDSLNKTIENIHNNPTPVDRIPSNLEILIRGVNNSKGLETLFSPKLDSILDSLFKKIESEDFEEILKDKEKIEKITNTLFGNGSFQGPISTAILNNIQLTLTSYKYNAMKSNLGKTVSKIKKLKLIIKNLERGSKEFKKSPEEYKKYKEAVYAIKQVLKFALIIYKNREIVNKKVLRGLNNIVHEDYDIDEPLYNWEAI